MQARDLRRDSTLSPGPFSLPQRSLHPCPTPGCPALVRHGHCEQHRRERERRRGSAASRGYDRRHQRWRLLVLARDPICRGCGQAASTVAEHVIPLTRGGTFAMSNGQGCCKSCADYKTAVEQRDTGFGPRLAAAGAVVGEPAPRGWRLREDW